MNSHLSDPSDSQQGSIVCSRRVVLSGHQSTGRLFKSAESARRTLPWENVGRCTSSSRWGGRSTSKPCDWQSKWSLQRVRKRSRQIEPPLPLC